MTERGRIAMALGAGLVYVALVDPHNPRAVMPRCPTKHVTGLDCPACGTLRLTHDLLHADLRAAVHDNPFLLVCSPMLGALLWRGLRARRRGHAAPVPPRTAYAIAGLAAVWMVVRNLDAWPLKPTVLA